MKSDNEIKFKDVPKEVRNFMKRTNKELNAKLKKATDNFNGNSEVAYVVKEGDEIKLITEDEALRNSLFPTLVKGAIKNEKIIK
jgi:hypothetical protein